MGKGLHTVFKSVIKEISQDLPLGEPGSEVSHSILEPGNFAEFTNFLYEKKKPWLKENFKEIKNLINNHTFIVEDLKKVGPVTPCMEMY